MPTKGDSGEENRWLGFLDKHAILTTSLAVLKITMEPQPNKYKTTVIWILAIVVIALIIMFAMKSRETVSDTLQGLNDKVQECRMRLTTWNETYPQGTTTPQSQTELDVILKDCSDVIEDASEEL